MDTVSPDNILNATHHVEDRIPYSVSAIFLTIEICICLIGLIGNIIACFVMACSRDLHTTIHFYLFSMSTSDILYLIVNVTNHVYEHYNKEYKSISSIAICALTIWLLETSTNVSVLTITVLAIERYLAICHPFVARSMSQKSRVIKIIVIIWILSALCASTLALPEKDLPNPDRSFCDSDVMPYSLQLMTVVFFVLPMAAIFALYCLIAKQLIARKQINCQIGDSSRKTLKMIAVIVVAFFVCWAPFHFTKIIVVYIADTHSDQYECYDAILQYSWCIAEISCLLSTAVNPIIYTFMSENFRKASKVSLLKCCSKSNSDSTISGCNQEQSTRTITSITGRM